MWSARALGAPSESPPSDEKNTSPHLSDLERHPVLLPELLELGHHAVRHARLALGVEAVHHPADEVDLVLDREVDKVGVNEHLTEDTMR